MTDESYIFLAGASSGVGREIAKLLIQLKVKALLRTEATRDEIEAADRQVLSAVDRNMMYGHSSLRNLA